MLYSLLPIGLFTLIMALLFLNLSGGKLYTVFLAMGIAFIVGLPLDRYCDNKFKNLKQIGGSDAA